MNIKSIFNLLSVGIIVLSFSCKDLVDTYDEYIEGGELVYRAKPIHTEAHPGYLRARIDWSLLFPNQVKKCLIFERDSLLAEIPVIYNDSVRLSCLLKNLKEKSYILNIYSEDSYGNRSIKVEQFVNIYGPRYSSSLQTNRKIEDALRKEEDNNSMKIILSPAIPEILSSKIIYQDTQGQLQSVNISPNTNEIFLNKVPISGTLSIQDQFQPDTLCIDTFSAPAINYDLSTLPSKNSRQVKVYRNVYNSAQIKLMLSRADNKTIKTVVRYPVSHSFHSIEVQPDEYAFILENVAEKGNIEVTTYFQDNEEAPVYISSVKKIDIENLPKKFKPFWKRYDVSDYQTNEGSPDYIFDDNFSTYWHTPYNNIEYINPNKGNDLYPHWITIDMGVSINITSFEVARRQNNPNFAKRIRFEVSEDAVKWEGEEFDVDNNHEGMQSFNLIKPLKGRYFKFTGLESGTGAKYMCMSEISIH